MIPIIAIRPDPGCGATIGALAAKRLEAYGFPLFTIYPADWSPPDPAGIDALLLGSANALRHGGSAVADYLGKPVYAVGLATAKAARKAGFAVIGTGEGGLQTLLGQVLPHHSRLLRLAGKRRTVLDVPPHITLTERVVYAATPLPLPPAMESVLGKRCVVMLHSAEAARHFAGLCMAHGIAKQKITLAAIGSRVSAAAGAGWRQIADAPTPSEDALLALAEELCQNEAP